MLLPTCYLVLDYPGTPICNLDFEFFVQTCATVAKHGLVRPRNLSFLSTTCRKVCNVLVQSVKFEEFSGPFRKVIMGDSVKNSFNISEIGVRQIGHVFIRLAQERQDDTCPHGSYATFFLFIKQILHFKSKSLSLSISNCSSKLRLLFFIKFQKYSKVPKKSVPKILYFYKCVLKPGRDILFPYNAT